MSGQIHRLATGGDIDRGSALRFSFDGQSLEGYAGDTLAAALLANGVRVVGRSWKYHRPRGIVCAGVEEPNALVQLGEGALTIPNVLATTQPLYAGLVSRSVNGQPTAARDRWAWLSLLSWFMPPGFYYKTFMWPQRLWMRYERLIRELSGLGTAPSEPDPDTYDKRNAHCDVLIVGAGPAGLAAARDAGRSGARVILVDEQETFGGQLLSREARISGQSGRAWIKQVLDELAAMPEVRLLPRATAFGYHDGNFLTIQERLTDHLAPGMRTGRRERLWRVRAREVILATGAHERPLVFADNDRPGILLASAALTYLRRYAVVPGRQVVVFTNNDSAYEVAQALVAAGTRVAALVDPRPRGTHPACEALRARGVRLITGSVIVDTRGAQGLSGVDVMALAGTGVRGPVQRIACDLLLTSGGWSPVIHLSSQSGAKAQWSDSAACFLPGTPVQREVSVGACRGSWSLRACLEEGAQAGTTAARRCGFAGNPAPPAATDQEAPQEIMPLWLVPGPKPPSRGPKQFVDLQNDVAAADILLAAREGYRGIEHAKRYTALGFGTDQGKLGNINGMAILAQGLGQDISGTGTTTFRPNYTPVTFGVIAGREVREHFDPVRKTPLHAWHESRGARFEIVGQWLRPWYYPRQNESQQEAVQRECRAVRTRVGVLDASTLGKIDIQGPDAARFLNLLYTNGWLQLAVGHCRYGLMLDENGMVFDDGVTTRLAVNHYLMTTTTGGAARVLAWMEKWHQTEWPQLQVYMTSVTDHWATLALAGPHSRALLSRVCADVDLAAAAFPFMTFRAGTVAGVSSRIMRISFSGELAFELNVPAGFARHVWDAVFAAGADLGVTPYGTEAMHVLRAEKGFIIVGQDTDGSVTPQDLGMDWIVAKGKDFLGRRSLRRADTARAGRKQLVGLLTDDPAVVLMEGSQVVAADRTASSGTPVPMQGHVTSAYPSEAAGRSIALALIADGRARLGQAVHVVDATGQATLAHIAAPVFYDPQGTKQNA